MLSKLLFASFLSAGLSLAPTSTDHSPITDCESAHHTASFELPSIENLIESPDSSEDLFVINLPEVEIFATYTGDDKCEMTTIDLLPVINLPEVEIFATYPCRKRHEAIVRNGEIIPVINLEPVVVTPERDV